MKTAGSKTLINWKATVCKALSAKVVKDCYHTYTGKSYQKFQNSTLLPDETKYKVKLRKAIFSTILQIISIVHNR